MTMRKAFAYYRYWQKHPPNHILMAAHVGYKYEKPENGETSQELMNFLQGLKQGGM